MEKERDEGENEDDGYEPSPLVPLAKPCVPETCEWQKQRTTRIELVT